MIPIDTSLAAPLGHALAARSDLPIPAWLFAWGAAIVLIVSFFALSAGWRTSRFEGDTWQPLRGALARVITSPPLAWICGSIGVFLLGLAVYAGLSGTSAPDRNFTLTFVFVTVWLGFPFLSVLIGDLFAPFNPWRAIGRASGFLFRSIARQDPAHLTYPEKLGRWPSAIGLVAFVWLEIVHGSTGGVAVGLAPDTVAIAALVYSAYTFVMMGIFGTETWCRRGEFLGVYFNMFSQLGVLEVRDGALGKRKPLAAATRWVAVPGSAAVVLASVATTTFDGAQEGVLTGPIEWLFERFQNGGLDPTWGLRSADTLFLVLCIAAVVAIYAAGVRGMRTVRGARPYRELFGVFAHSLIPIAFAYLFAHYFSLFAYQEQAQFTYLLSDPLGTGATDIFGTAGSGIDYGILSANAIWYVQVGSLVIGHALGLTLAHDKAVALWGDYRDAARSQYWMLAMMVAFTSLGLYLLSVANE